MVEGRVGCGETSGEDHTESFGGIVDYTNHCVRFPDVDRCDCNCGYCIWGTGAGTWRAGSLGSELSWRTGR
jgi:hypothetical protein